MRNTDPTPATVKLVRKRDEDRCAKCGFEISGVRGFDWSVSHRRPRGMGGDRRPEANLPGNLVLLHGHGTSGCHGEVESRRADAIMSGQTVHKSAIPSQVAIEHAVHGWCYLDDVGDWSTDPVEVFA